VKPPRRVWTGAGGWPAGPALALSLGAGAASVVPEEEAELAGGALEGAGLPAALDTGGAEAGVPASVVVAPSTAASVGTAATARDVGRKDDAMSSTDARSGAHGQAV
jgi:hypothetical protein